MTSVVTVRRPHIARRIVSQGLGDGVVIALLIAWWWLARGRSADILPAPQVVLQSAWRLVQSGTLLPAVAATFGRVLLATLLATVVGTALAFVPVRFPVLRPTVVSLVQPVLNAVPSVGWAILAAIWMGVSDTAVITTQFAIMLSFCLINALQGIAGLDRELLEMAVTFGRTRRAVAWHILLPAMLPNLLASIRIAYGVGWKISLVCELFGTDRGIGALLMQAQTNSDTPLVFVCCLVIVAVALVTDRLVLEPLIRRALRHY